MFLKLSLLVGIIVDSFQEFSENLDEEKDIKENICYICSLHREKFEKKGIKFENHHFYYYYLACL